MGARGYMQLMPATAEQMASREGKSDDGESGAGMVILRMLERAERSGELIIVTRWYGGKHLGGDRFRHVQEATRLYLDHPAS